MAHENSRWRTVAREACGNTSWDVCELGIDFGLSRLADIFG